MSAHLSTSNAMGRAERLAWIVGAVGVVGAAVGWALVPRDFAFAWLAATVAFSGWPLGSIALVLAHSLTGGHWGETARPALLIGVLATPLVALFALPVLIMLPTLYPWARAGELLNNGWYLNIVFFAIRGVFYLATWFVLAWLTLVGGPRLHRIAPPGVLLLAVTFTFASIDFTMSLEPKFASNIYGMLSSTGAGLLALAVAIILTAPGAAPRVRNDLGKLLLALTILWTYLDFMQLLIVWQADLVSQAPWYLHRAFGFWSWVMGAVALGHSAIPILLLFWPQVRKSGWALPWIAAWLVLWEVVRAWWTVLPAAPRQPGWVDLASLLAVGGIATGFVLWRARLRRLGGSREMSHA
ncbi:MAG: hypothetical protein JO157_18460 [Acetobacteraceae bacterium]|nr:hypothetical protein [Acetobacteraceae bacterium]